MLEKKAGLCNVGGDEEPLRHLDLGRAGSIRTMCGRIDAK